MSPAAYPTAWEADVLLRDGHPVHLRPICPEDAEALRAFHGQLSPRSVYFRFFSAKPVLTDADVAYFTEVDHRSRVALLALDRDVVIGVGRFDALGDGSAEVAFVVRDDRQGLGLGSILLEHLAAAAREVGVSRFTAEVLPENSRMLSTFREAGFVLDQRREEDVIAVSFDIEPTDASVTVMAEREHRAEARSMQRMLHPECVAVVGASRTPGGLGHAILRHLVDGGYAGELVAVHPEVDAIAGVRCVRSLTEVGRPIDLAVVVVPAAAVADVVRDAAQAQVHGLVVVSGGFGDSGPEGMALQADLVSEVHRAGMRLIGPNALGVINTDPDVRLNASLVPRMPATGGAGFFCQSGALGTSILDRAASVGLGVSTFVSAGNRADVSGNDLLQFWQEDPSTSVVLLHLETIGNARKFARLVAQTSRTTPVVMVSSGGAAPRHPLGHAVARSGLSQQAVDQVLADAGLVVVDSIERLLDVGRVVAEGSLPQTPVVSVVSNSDALSVIAENAILGRGLIVDSTRLAFPRQVSAQAYADAVRERIHDPDVGAVLVIHVPPIERPSDHEIRAALRSCTECGHDPHAPVVAVLPGPVGPSSPADVPVFADVEEAVHALADAYGITRWRTEAAERMATHEEPWLREEVDVAGMGPRVEAGAAAAVLTAAGNCGVVVDPDVVGARGCVIRLVDDPLFGMVVTVGVDDAVAELLSDQSARLAPVTRAVARDMITRLGALPALRLAGEGELALLAQAVSDTSHLHLRAPGVRGAVLRHVTVTEGGDVAVGDARLTISESAAEAPTARRL